VLQIVYTNQKMGGGAGPAKVAEAAPAATVQPVKVANQDDDDDLDIDNI
jgi:hypothetical protein